MKTNKNHIQQGDVLLRKVKTLPTGCVRLKHKTIARGEHTGHHHSFDGAVALMEAPDETVYAVNEGTNTERLIHQEHGPVTIEPGEIVESGQVREKDWCADMVRPVTD